MARYVTVSSVSHRPEVPYQDIDARLRTAEMYATRAARLGADIVSFPEVYIQYGAPIEAWPEIAEKENGKTLSFMADFAKRQHMYVIWPIARWEGARLYNSSVLLDRNGEIAGVYHKMFPTIGEIDANVIPGDGAPVFETDFGRIGMAICFDLNFRPIIEGLAKNGAEIVFFSSMYRGGLQIRAWAQELGCYFVSAICTELGMIVDMGGDVLAEATYEAVIAQRINLDRRMLHMDYNWDKMDAMLEKYGKGVSFKYYTREAKYTVASEMPDKTVDDLIQEYGLEGMNDYFERAMRRRQEKLDSLK